MIESLCTSVLFCLTCKGVRSLNFPQTTWLKGKERTALCLPVQLAFPQHAGTDSKQSVHQQLGVGVKEQTSVIWNSVSTSCLLEQTTRINEEIEDLTAWCHEAFSYYLSFHKMNCFSNYSN